jgi:acetyltransferase-like isoleucine patch superfamily enzyme
MNTMNLQSTFSRVQKYGKEYLITGILGGVPTSIGQFLRNFFYRFVLESIGKSVHILPNVRLIGADNIQIEDGVRFKSNAVVRSHGNKAQFRKNVLIDYGVDIRTGGGDVGVFSDGISIGEETYIGPYVCIAGPGSIRIGRDCKIASHSSIYANNHIFSDPSQPLRLQGVTTKGIVIEDDCWLGTGVRVLDGVTIGRGSIIGAGAVVTKSIPPYSIAVGVPAKVIGRRGVEQSILAV